MRKNLRKIILFSLLSFLVASCATKEDDNFIEQNNKPVGELTTVDIKIILPEGSNLDLTKTTLSSSLDEFSVSSNGDTEAIHNQNGRSLVMLLNKEKEPILMGFITDNKNEVSVKTTLEVAYYFGLGTIYLPEEIRERYFNESDQLSNIDEFTTEASAMFNADVNFLSTENFKTALKERIDAIRYDADTTINIRSKVIKVDERDTRSGMKIKEVDFESVLIVNSWRRRSHAFLYKTAFKNEAGKETIIISDIAKENASPKIDLKVSATKAVRDVLGGIQDLAGGEGGSWVETTTDPIKLELKDSESESTYQVRIIGPILTDVDLDLLTNLEEDKYDQLQWETLGYDLLLPLALDIVGHAKLLNGLSEKKFEPFIKALIIFASSIDAVNVPLNAGDYKKAMTELLNSMVKNTNNSQVEPMLKAIMNGVKSSAKDLGPTYFAQSPDKIIKKLKGFLKALEAADIFLKLVDYGRIYYHLGSSNLVEQWEVRAKQTNVKLSPQESVVFPLVLKPLSATIQENPLSAGQTFEYKWSTTGNYGILKDNVAVGVGKESISFSKASNENKMGIFYFSEEDEESLPDNAIDEVTVEVITKGPGDDISVGKDTVTIFVKAFKYEINPNGATIEGGTNVTLYIEKPDKSDNITTNPELDFKIVWSTEGKYGLFSGISNQMTVYNSNAIGYFCLDKDVENGTETVKARIYGKLKEEGDDAYGLYDEIEAVINIENDDHKRTYIAPVSSGISVFGGAPYFMTLSYSYVGVPIDPDAVSYSVKILEHIAGGLDTTSYYPPTAWSNHDYGNLLLQNASEFQPRLAMATYRADHPNAGETQAKFAAIKGYAQVTIYYK